MPEKIDVKQIDRKIRRLKDTTEELYRLSEGFPALEKNTARILTCVKMLELNVSDVVDLQV
jgi:hypothetical protein